MFVPISILYKLFEQHPIVSTDTRAVIPNSIFFALKGANFNGNKFAKQALEQGCAYAVVDEEQVVEGKQYIYVPNVLEALQALANYHRRALKTPIIAITGSNGKTTTKELIAAVLSKKYNTLFTTGNFNNHIGVPLTLLQLKPEHELAVVEMGANHVGEIKELCAIAEPNFGMITNIGKAHLEGFGGYQGVIKAKNEMYDFLKKEGTLFINADDDLLLKLSEAFDKKITYGVQHTADICATLISTQPYLKIQWKRKTASNFVELETKLIGKYNLPNVLAAIAIGVHFNVPEALINKAVADYAPSNSRSQLIEKNTNRIILDAYNANPTSMKAAIENFIEMGYKNNVFILGDMLELGDEANKEHKAILDLLNQKQVNTVFIVGAIFKQNNLEEKWISFDTVEELCIHLKQNPLTDTSILIKGSRGIKLEKVLDFL